MNLEILQIISLIIAIPSSLFAFMVMVSNPFRKWVFNKRQEEKKKEDVEADRVETDRCLLRSNITDLYYKHQASKEMQEWEYENLSRLYTQYKKLGGNSFVDKIWDEIQNNWTVLR